MAIYHLAHSHIGKATQKQAHTASAHADYITRPNSAQEVLAAHMPSEWRAAMAWLRDQEDNDRKNARVIDKVEIALPKELTHEQNAELVRAFCESMTGNRAPWLAAMHDGPKDQDNPHAHIIFRDRDIETGRRVMNTSELGSTERFREAWERHANLALERAGHDVRIDRRTLEAQGIAREPEIHVGPKSAVLQAKGLVPVSEIIVDPRWSKSAAGKPEIREALIDYPAIDQGRTRAAFNEAIKLRNAEREMAQSAPRPLTLREKMEQHLAAMPERMRKIDEERLAQQKAEEERQAERKLAAQRKRDARRERETGAGPSWTDRAGMAAQQRSALEWARQAQQKKEQERGPAKEHPSTPAPSPLPARAVPPAVREHAAPIPVQAHFVAVTPVRPQLGQPAVERQAGAPAPARTHAGQQPAATRVLGQEAIPGTAPVRETPAAARAAPGPAREVTDRRAETKDAARSVSDLDIERARFAAALDRSLARQRGESERERDGGRER